MAEVTVSDGTRMSLLGWMLSRILRRNITALPPDKPLTREPYSIEITAGSMCIFVIVKPDSVTVQLDPTENPSARVQGSMDTFLNLSLNGKMVGPVLSRRLRFSGKIPALLRFRKLIMVKGGA